MIICLFKKSRLELINVHVLEKKAYIVIFHGLDTKLSFLIEILLQNEFKLHHQRINTFKLSVLKSFSSLKVIEVHYIKGYKFQTLLFAYLQNLLFLKLVLCTLSFF